MLQPVYTTQGILWCTYKFLQMIPPTVVLVSFHYITRHQKTVLNKIMVIWGGGGAGVGLFFFFSKDRQILFFDLTFCKVKRENET